MSNINETWLDLVSNIIANGSRVGPRGQGTLELTCQQSTVDMNQPVLGINDRNMGYRFMCAEAWWILSGQNRVETIAPYAKMISNFSDDGIMYNGAYGPMIIDQLTYIADCFEKDIHTRQAVLTIWRPNPRESKDIPCTVAINFYVRDGKLYCHDVMRSSDVWLGWVYDVFNFSCLSMWLVLALRLRGIEVELGDLTLTATSQHLYDRNYEEAYKSICDGKYTDFDKVDLSQFDHPDELVTHLKNTADSITNYRKRPDWLNDLIHKKGN